MHVGVCTWVHECVLACVHECGPTRRNDGRACFHDCMHEGMDFECVLSSHFATVQLFGDGVS